jgi:hypothetical protein
MVWVYFIGEKLGLIIICEDEGIKANKYMNICYNSLYSVFNDLLDLLEDADIIQVTNKNPLMFM